MIMSTKECVNIQINRQTALEHQLVLDWHQLYVDQHRPRPKNSMIFLEPQSGKGWIVAFGKWRGWRSLYQSATFACRLIWRSFKLRANNNDILWWIFTRNLAMCVKQHESRCCVFSTRGIPWPPPVGGAVAAVTVPRFTTIVVWEPYVAVMACRVTWSMLSSSCALFVMGFHGNRNLP